MTKQEEYMDGILQSEWCIEVTKTVLKVVQSMKHHQKFSRLIVTAIAKKLGENYTVWSENGHFKYETYVQSRPCSGTGNKYRKISFYAVTDEPWADKMIAELNQKLKINEGYAARLRQELTVHSRLQELTDELMCKKQTLQAIARNLLPPYESCNVSQDFTYATKDIFPELLKD